LVFESLTEAQWVAFSFLLLGLALICGMLLRQVLPWLAAVYIPPSVLAGFLILLAGRRCSGG
jgi:ESS family glutamate:Na+ symporter